jgi:cyclic pyranopterin phosphate synthase
MPAERVPDNYGFDAASRLSFEKIETLVRGFVRAGVTKLRITGGEPLLRKRLPELVARLAAIEGLADIALTTNGSLLAPHAHALREAGLHRITVSLDALDPRRRGRSAKGYRGSEDCRVRADQAQLRGTAQRQRERSVAARRIRARTGPRHALHRIHGRRHL